MKEPFKFLWKVIRWSVNLAGAALIIYLIMLASTNVKVRSGTKSVLNSVAGFINPVQSTEQTAYLASENDRLRVTKELLTDQNFIFANMDNWPKLELGRNNSPLFYFEGKWEWREATIQDRENKYEGQARLEVTDEQGKIICTLVKALNLGSGFKAWCRNANSSDIEYWRWNEPIYCNLSCSIASANNAPMTLIPAAQRSSDGTFSIRGYVYSGDVAFKEALPPAPWGRGMPMTNTLVNGRPKIIDRYVVVLARGQKSQRLIYSAPAWDDGEEGHFKRKCQIRAINDCTYCMTINGNACTVTPGDCVNMSEIDTKGSFIVEVKLGEDAKQPEIPVEFVYYREKL